ncbi:MAG: hypothetical protein QXI12_10455, partial [Candidatus Methanomethyliaceae archaeon]
AWQRSPRLPNFSKEGELMLKSRETVAVQLKTAPKRKFVNIPGLETPRFPTKLCNNYVESVTGYSLYHKFLDPSSTTVMAEKLAKAVNDLSDVDFKKYELTREKATALAEWFRICAENEYFLVENGNRRGLRECLEPLQKKGAKICLVTELPY